ncbi:MAG TPA: hypothetical protein VLV56_11240 [Burkholderiales bacterium]|nr:hypothetical protein [Burkholderiales bacterium]
MRPRFARREHLGLSKAEFAVLERLGTPQKIQDFLNQLPANFEVGGQTCLSVREVLRQRRAHCIEGAMLAACALWVHGEPPLLLDLRAERDYDHVVALFRRGGCWGAISKTNPALLRWRDPVYRSLRELAMSYLHEYANKRNQKTLRSYAGPFDLRRFDPKLWVTSEKNCWDVGATLDDLRHRPLITRKQARALRLRDALERKAGALAEHRPPPRGR